MSTSLAIISIISNSVISYQYNFGHIESPSSLVAIHKKL